MLMKVRQYILILMMGACPLMPLDSKEGGDLEFSEIEAVDFENVDLDGLLDEEADAPDVSAKDLDGLLDEEADAPDVSAKDLDDLLEEESPAPKKASARKKDEEPLDDLDRLLEEDAPPKKKSMSAKESDELDSLDLDAMMESEHPKKKGGDLALPKDWEADKKLKVSRKFGDGVSGEDLEVLRLEKIFDEDRLREINLQKLEGKKIIDLNIREKIERGSVVKKEAKAEAPAPAEEAEKKVVVKKDEGDFNIDLSEEEKKLLGLARYVERKIPGSEWDEIATQASDDKYIIQSGDWLWKISERLFGTGFYYSKLWALNPHITNPHQVEPGMVLVFSTGSSDELPEVQLGTFEEEEKVKDENGKKKVVLDPKKSAQRITSELQKYGHGVEPPWMKQRNKLLQDGFYFEYASEETYADLEQIGSLSLEDDYQKYNPPIPEIIIAEPNEDNVGFDKDSIINIDIKEGFALTTFLTKDAIVDLGQMVDLDKMGYILVKERERIYIKFNDDVNVQAGDFFSIYKFGGPVHYKYSDRKGYRYTIAGHIKVIKKFREYWEVEVQDVRDVIDRNARITYYVPKLRRSSNTFNRRNIEAAIIGAYVKGRTHASLGDVVYLDRGRADGVEMGNVFQVYSSLKKDRHDDFPKRKVGLLRVITLMDDFSTALVVESSDVIELGALSSTEIEPKEPLVSTGGDGVDIELHLKDSVKDVLSNAEKVKLTRDEMEELNREEEKYSVIEDDERDLRELERLEGEIVAAEKALKESRNDEDKFLEGQDLNELEKQRLGQKVAEDFAPMNDIEGEVGVKYLDQELDSRENPYGLSEFDLEEIDELYNRTKL